ncbi:hypothetical protein GCK72_016610 [Caenorhabditis remanei]|uniref:Uncharacterized protein n=1 Tax=Caenorhabditis remanei TaxID=31234 RepID=A0A6A5G650_CAERE|nr:hypothetical protein GCK72_016610 [Caenorhabditis remanei]KAF1750064.1 hypothetical protein GCK72_016610 [Caenorhabditis remanei]
MGVLNLNEQVGEGERLEALAVDDRWTGFVVLLLGDAHLLEGGEGSEDGSSDPDGVLALWWSVDPDLHGAEKRRELEFEESKSYRNLRWGKSGHLLLHAISNSWVHGGSSGENNVGVQVLTSVNIALHDGVVHSLVDSGRLHSQEGWLKMIGIE